MCEREYRLALLNLRQCVVSPPLGHLRTILTKALLLAVDITTVIPSEGHPYPRGDDLAKSPLSLHNPSFFISHPLHLCGPQQLFMKAVVLLGKVVQFQQRAPYVSTTSGAGSALDDAISDMRTTCALFMLSPLLGEHHMLTFSRRHPQ